MTISDKEIIIEMLENDGIYPGDPQAYSIYSYTGINGEELFAVFMDERWVDIYTSPYVIKPILLWEICNGITSEGRKLIMNKGK